MEEKASNQSANINNPTSPKAAKPTAQKGANPLASLIVWILGMCALIVVLKIISYLFWPDVPSPFK